MFTGPAGKNVTYCGTVSGNVICEPETLRRTAAAAMRANGLVGPLTLGAYSLARYVASEVGGGTPEEKMAVALAGIQQARESYLLANLEQGLVRLFLYRTPGSRGYGKYGPIHSDDKGGHPFGRWASTSQDPTVQEVQIALFALSGRADGFARQARNQFGPDAAKAQARRRGESDAAVYNGIHDWISGLAKKMREYWIGDVAAINPRHTMLFARRALVAPSSPEGQIMIQNAVEASFRPPLAIPTVICSKPAGADVVVARSESYKPYAVAGGALAFAAAVGWAVSSLA
jgi:hypothetical protein